MASAVIYSRNEQCWAERKAYSRNYPKNPPNNAPQISTRFDPNPSPNNKYQAPPAQNQTRNRNSSIFEQRHDLENSLRQRNEPPPQRLLLPPPPAFSVSELSHQNKTEGRPVQSPNPFHREYLTFNLSSYSGNELKELKNRLIADLERVRSLLTRIDTRPIKPGPSGPSYSAKKRNPKINKNPKRILGKKGAAAQFSTSSGPGPNPKRPKLMVEPGGGVKNVGDAMMIKCKQILLKLMKIKYSNVFCKPVDVQGMKLFDYYQIIKQPMDLGTIKSRLNKKEYKRPLDFASDVRLTFQNALKYNPNGHAIHTLAGDMLSKFEEWFGPEFQKYESEYRKVMAENLVNQRSRLPARPKQPVVVVVEELPPVVTSVLQVDKEMVVQVSGKLAKSKAKNLKKRPMTYEEKERLGSALRSIPEGKMEQVMQIVRKRNPQLLQEGEEIELDIDLLDVETLWELDKFANYHERNVGGKLRRRQDLTVNPSLNEVPETPDYELPLTTTEVSGQMNKAGEEDVDIGEEIPAHNFPPVEIEKDNGESSSSSSSNSNSGDDSSSSSDSESGSSSDEDSVQSPFIETPATPIC